MNNEKNKEYRFIKAEETMKIGDKSNKTFMNYKSHILRFLNNYFEDTTISKIKEEEIAKYILDNYIKLNV